MAQMTYFVTAFRPGFYLATNSAADGFIRSVILSRFPIVASRSWLHGSDLTPFGYTASGFTRDLFEAQIAVPSFPQPLHVFTVHLKSGAGSADDANKRAAEAGAVSNFLVSAFLESNSLHPYLLTGDMNEDILRLATGSDTADSNVSPAAATGLQLTTPFNPISQQRTEFFHSEHGRIEPALRLHPAGHVAVFQRGEQPGVSHGSVESHAAGSVR